MKEKLQSKLLEILTSIQNATGKTADFAMSELPDIAQQYLVFGRVRETLFFTVSLIASILIFWGVVMTYKRINNDSQGVLLFLCDDEEVLLFLCCFLLISVSLFMFSINTFIMIWTAPKVWLLQELANLVK